MVEKYHYSYDEFIIDTKSLLKDIKQFQPQAIVAIARGGVTFGHFIANGLDNRNFFIINSIGYNDTKQLDQIELFNIPTLDKFNTILIVDDIVDSGKTLKKVLDTLSQKYPKTIFKTVSLFYKQSAIIQPDFKNKEATKWIDFFWEDC